MKYKLRATDLRWELTSVGIRLFVLLGLLVAGAAAARAQDAEANKEYQVKAAFLLNFAQFIQWPEHAGGDADAPLLVGVLGEDPFGEVLEQTFKDQTVQGRRLAVKRSHQIEDLQSCHVLFISKSERAHVPELLTKLRDASVVTIGEIDKFAERGGIINFYIENGRVRFEINDGTARRKGFKISSQLLKRAKIVRSDAEEGKD